MDMFVLANDEGVEYGWGKFHVAVTTKINCQLTRYTRDSLLINQSNYFCQLPAELCSFGAHVCLQSLA